MDRNEVTNLFLLLTFVTFLVAIVILVIVVCAAKFFSGLNISQYREKKTKQRCPSVDLTLDYIDSRSTDLISPAIKVNSLIRNSHYEAVNRNANNVYTH